MVEGPVTTSGFALAVLVKPGEVERPTRVPPMVALQFSRQMDRMVGAIYQRTQEVN